MNSQVTRSYHATVRQSDDLEVLITTIQTNGYVFWSATLAKTTRPEGRHTEYEGLGMVSCSQRYASHDDALESAISYFDGTIKDVCDDTYTGEWFPAGWDAADHKALYE